MAGIAAAILGAGAIGAGASIFAASKQTKMAQQAIAQQRQMFDIARGEAQPFITAGAGAAGTLSDLLKPGADMSALLENIPGMKFLQQLTQQGISNQATTTGLGGNTLLAGSQAGTQLALSQGWLPIVSALQGLVNTGAGSAAALGGQAVQTGQGVAGSLTGIGNAQAGAATAFGSNIGNALTTASLAPILTKLLAQGQQGGANYTGAGMYNPNQQNPAFG